VTDVTDASKPGAAHQAAPASARGPNGPAEAVLRDDDDMNAEAEAFAQAAEHDPELEADIEAADVEADIDLAVLAKERDDYLDALRRLQADFENYKKRMVRQQTEHLERAAEALVAKLLPVFDTADLAIAHGGGEGVQQVWSALFDTLEKEGLERIDPVSEPFDPVEHEAVMHEPGEGAAHVVDVMRAGYRWKGRVLRPAMVKVAGS
jgi:molecular chaperone GrpE